MEKSVYAAHSTAATASKTMRLPATDVTTVNDFGLTVRRRAGAPAAGHTGPGAGAGAGAGASVAGVLTAPRYVSFPLELEASLSGGRGSDDSRGQGKVDEAAQESGETLEEGDGEGAGAGAGGAGEGDGDGKGGADTLVADDSEHAVFHAHLILTRAFALFGVLIQADPSNAALRAVIDAMAPSIALGRDALRVAALNPDAELPSFDDESKPDFDEADWYALEANAAFDETAYRAWCLATADTIAEELRKCSPYLVPSAANASAPSFFAAAATSTFLTSLGAAELFQTLSKDDQDWVMDQVKQIAGAFGTFKVCRSSSAGMRRIKAYLSNMMMEISASKGGSGEPGDIGNVSITDVVLRVFAARDELGAMAKDLTEDEQAALMSMVGSSDAIDSVIPGGSSMLGMLTGQGM